LINDVANCTINIHRYIIADAAAASMMEMAARSEKQVVKHHAKGGSAKSTLDWPSKVNSKRAPRGGASQARG